MRVKVLFVLHNGVVVVLFLDQLQEATAYKLPKKVRRLAIKSALSSKVLKNNIVVFESLSFEAPKTKEFVAVLKES